MKINNNGINNNALLQQYQQTQQQNKSNAAIVNPDVSLSLEASSSEIQALQQALTDVSSVDITLVEEIVHSLQKGSYQTNAEAVAESLLLEIKQQVKI